MSKKRLVLGVLLCAALTWCYRAGAPAVASAAPVEAGDGWGRVSAVPGRIGHGVGVVSARVVAPAVRRMVSDTEIQLRVLRQDLRGATRLTQSERHAAQTGITQISALDSLALRGLADGHPIDAFRQAMQAGGLARAVQGNVRRDGN